MIGELMPPLGKQAEHKIVSTTGVLASLLSVSLGGLRLFIDGVDSTLALVLFAAGMAFACVPVLERFKRHRLARWLLPLTATISTLVMAWVEDGLYSEACVWMPLVPFVAVISIGTRAATVVGALTWIGISIISFGHLKLGMFPESAPQLVILRAGSIMGAVVFSVIVGKTYKNLQSQLQGTLEELASTHPISNLPSRRAFRNNIKAALMNHDGIALLYIDIDGFKKINDSLGHTLGDDILRAIGLRLQSITREGETPFHLSGDEFAVIIKENNSQTLEIIRARFEDALSNPVEADGAKIPISASVGYSLASPGDSPRSVIERADQSMYERKAKRSSGFSALKPSPVV